MSNISRRNRNACVSCPICIPRIPSVHRRGNHRLNSSHCYSITRGPKFMAGGLGWEVVTITPDFTSCYVKLASGCILFPLALLPHFSCLLSSVCLFFYLSPPPPPPPPLPLSPFLYPSSHPLSLFLPLPLLLLSIPSSLSLPLPFFPPSLSLPSSPSPSPLSLTTFPHIPFPILGGTYEIGTGLINLAMWHRGQEMKLKEMNS